MEIPVPLVALAFLLPACNRETAGEPAPSPPAGNIHRDLDPVPIESAAENELPPGIVHASFALNTGGDQMSTRRVDAGLVLHVSFDRRHFRQQFASCADAGHGDALGDGDPSVLDWALCDGTEYTLQASESTVEVREVKTKKVVTHISLPPGSRVGAKQ